MKNPGQLMGVLATFAIGCSDSGPSPSAGFTERDSLGIIIVDNKAPRWTEKTRWRLDEAPLVDIGRADGEAPYLLDRVRQALRLRDGRIAVLSYGLNEIRIFDPAGRYLQTIGRRGEGPGEFRGLWWMAELPGDSILAADIGLNRLTVFGQDGSYVRSYRWRSLPGTMEPYVLGRFSHGSIVAVGHTNSRVPARAAGFTRSIDKPYTLDHTGAPRDTLGTFVSQMGGTDAMVPLAMRATAEIVIAGDQLYFAPGDILEVNIHNVHGELRRIIRYHRPLRPVTDQDRARDDEAMQTEFRRRNAPPEIVARYRNLAYPPFFPAHGQLVVDQTGAIWLADHQIRYERLPVLWTIFNAEGHLLGTLTLPAAFNVDQIGENFVLGRWTDELGVEHVRLHRLTRN
jgi:hypothetical protein